MRAHTRLVLLGLGGLSCGPAHDPSATPEAPAVAPEPSTAPTSDHPTEPTSSLPADSPPSAQPTVRAPPTTGLPPGSPVQRYAREYVACGCGCCGGAGGPAAQEKPQCVSAAELDQIIAADAQASNNPQCAVMGCALGTRYAVCE